MNAFSVDLKDMIEAQILTLSFGTNFFIGAEPDTPHNVVTIYDTSGWPPDPKLDYENPTAQVRVRNKAYTTGWDLAHDIMQAIHNKNEETWNGTRYLAVFADSDVLFIGRDEDERFIFTVNFRTTRV